MNLREDHMSQLLSDALDSLKLTEKDRELAKQYVEEPEGADDVLLEQVEYQDFAGLTGTEHQACLTWCKELREQAGEEERLSRYVKFTAAVGGASACHVLVKNRDIQWLSEWITMEQRTAMRAEMYAHDSVTLQQGSLSVLVSMGQKDPDVLLRAMDLCRGQDDAPRILLAGEYLYCMTLASVKNEQTVEVSDDLQQRLLARLPELFGGGTLSGPELSALQEHVQRADLDAPLPAEILRILHGRQCPEYSLALLAGCAYLALEQGPFFAAFLRLAAAVSAESGRSGYRAGQDRFLTVIRHMTDSDWFYRHVRFLMEKMPIDLNVWISWSLRTYEESIWHLMLKEYPEAVREAARALELFDYDRLLERVQRVVPERLQEFYDPGWYEEKAAEELITNFETEAETARSYLLGEIPLAQLLPFVKEWRKTASGCYGNRDVRLEKLRDDPQMQEIYQRAIAMEGLLMHGAWFRIYMFRTPGGNSVDLLSAGQLGEIFGIFQKEQMPVPYQLDTLSCIHESYHRYDSTRDQEAFEQVCIQALEERIEAWGAEYQRAARDGAAMTRIFCIRVMDRHWQEHGYKETLLSCAPDSSKQVQQVLLELYAGHREWEPEIMDMLGSGKLKERQMAVWVLKQWGAEQYRQELSQALEKEKNKKLADDLRKLLGSGQDVDLLQLAKEILKGGRRQKVRWAFDRPFDILHTLDGEEAPEEYLPAILVSYAYMESPGIHKDAVRLADQLQKAELSACMVELFHRWLNAGAEAKKRWVLYASSIHGGEAILPLLHQQIKELPAKSRGAMAVEAVRALSLNGSSAALLLVDQISRKFRYRQVKQGAAAALADAARELGISQEELEDRIVPDLGFDGRMEQRFDYGARAFTVRLTPALEVEVYGADGKRLKNLPVPGKQDDPKLAPAANAAFKQMKKQLKTVAASQKLRLSQALATGRFWLAERWQELFVNNPVMHQFATGLIWGLYENGTLKAAFRYMEDGTFNTMEEEEYVFPEKGLIGLVHPVELPEEERAAWQEQLSDYEITQPVGQLSRPVYETDGEEAAETELTRFRGTAVNGLSLSGKLLGLGWSRGPVGDGGMYRTFYREDGDVGVELSFSGCGITCENMDVTVQEAVFYRPGAGADGKGGKKRCFLGEVSARYFSEIVLQIALGTGAERMISKG